MGIAPENILTEKMTGKNTEREKLRELLGKLRDGDTVVVESLSRLSRSAKDLLSLVDGFERSGVTFVSMKEQIDTQTPYGKLIFTVLAALAQFEREIIVSRTREGLAAARARGRKGGRPPCDQKRLEQAVKLHAANAHTIREIHMLTGISQSSLYRELNRRKEGACTQQGVD